MWFPFLQAEITWGWGRVQLDILFAVSTISQNQTQIIELKNHFSLLIAFWAEKKNQPLSDVLLSEKCWVYNNVYCTLSFVNLGNRHI